MNLLTPIQDQLLQVFRDAREESDEYYPSEITGYGGQLKDPGRIIDFPALYVDIPGQFEIEPEDALFELLNMHGNPELVLFAENAASDEANRQSIGDLCDWAITTLQGKMLRLNDRNIPIQRITGRVLPEYGQDGEIGAAVLQVQLTSFKDS